MSKRTRCLSVGDLVGLAGVEVDAQGIGEAGVPAHHVEAEVAGLGLAGLDVADQQLDAVELVARAIGEHMDAVDGGGTVVADLDPQGEGVAGADLPGLDDAGDEAEARGGAYLAADLAGQSILVAAIAAAIAASSARVRSRATAARRA
jgi:hypothetical protein